MSSSGVEQTGLQQVAATPVAGFALQNGTPNVISWTAPNDGQNHTAMVAGSEVVTALQTGGAVQITFTPPGGAAHSVQLSAGGLAAGSYSLASAPEVVVGPGTTVTVAQSSAQTAGAATLFVALFGL